MKVAHPFIKQPLWSSLLTIFLLVFGFLSIAQIPVEQTPRVVIPWITATIIYPGASPSEVETDIVNPVEEELKSLENKEYFYAIAFENAAFVSVKYFDNVNIEKALQDVKDAIDRAKPKFPEDAEEPSVQNVDFDNVPVLNISIYGSGDMVYLKKIAEELKVEVESIPGVREAQIFGGLKEELHIDIDPHKLYKNSVFLPEVVGAIRKQNLNMPGGILDGSQSKKLVRTTGRADSIEDLGKVVVGESSGSRVLLSDVADISMGHEDVFSISKAWGEQAVTLIVKKKARINTLETTEMIQETVNRLKEKYPDHIKFMISGKQSTLIKRQLKQLGSNALLGSFLVIFALFLGMGLRNSLILAICIPLVILFTISGFYVAGKSVSGIAIFSTILILGMVVDGALIVGEAIYHYLEKGHSPKEAAIMGINEVGYPVIAADLTTIAAFIPMISMPGVSGQFMAVMPIVVTFAMIGSVVVDHFLLPAACAKFMKAKDLKRKTFGDRVTSKFSFVFDAYKKIMSFLLRPFRWLYLVAFFILLTIPLFYFGSQGMIGFEFFPQVDNGRFNINYKLPQTSGVFDTLKAAEEVEDIIESDPDIRDLILVVGQTSALNSDLREGGSTGPNYGKFIVELTESTERKATQDEVIDRLRAKLDKVAGLDYSVKQLREGPPAGSPVTIRLYSKDIDALLRAMSKSERIIKNIPGSTDVTTNYSIGKEEVRIKVRRQEAMDNYGISSADVAGFVQTAITPLEVSKFYKEGERINITARLRADKRAEIEDVKKMWIVGKKGIPVRIEDIADLEVASSLDHISHRDGFRYATVRSDVENGVTADQLRKKFAEFLPQLPSNVRVEISGDNEERDRSFKSLIFSYWIGITLIFLILVAQFKSFLQPFLVMISIPLSVIGVIWGLAITGVNFGFMAGVGIVALSGIVVNDAIVLVDYANKCFSEGDSIEEAALNAGIRRFRPVVLTTVTTIGGLFPMYLGLGGGAEFWQPLAVSLIFGLAMATILTLVLLPVTYKIMRNIVG